jgi:hypothetical protein
MPINWEKINADNGVKLLQPRDIFTALASQSGTMRSASTAIPTFQDLPKGR